MMLNKKMNIHSAAVIDAKARLADQIEVGPYAIIGPNVEIEKNVKIGPHVVIDGYTTIGEGTHVFAGACIGSIPQDLKYKGVKSFLRIGKNNTIREYATFNPGTDEGSVTQIGDGNLFMAYSHVAHDCKVGSNCIIANSGTLAGHVTLEDRVVIGGLTAIHQFVTIGRLSIVGGCSKVVQDVPPFSTCDGHPVRIYGLNSIGLSRAGISKESQTALKKAFRILFRSKLSFKNGLDKVREEIKGVKEVDYLTDFIKKSTRGVCRGGK
ncbi:MAG: acyl-ACP--UDP-N-acetylglucosamine O-acyltransferase [Candidatus Omnitrophota bacterium]